MRIKLTSSATFCFSIAGVLCLVACRADPSYPKQAPIDLASQAGPPPSAYSSESDLTARLPTKVQPLYDQGRDGHFSGVGGLSIHYHVNEAPGEKGAVVLLPGRTEAVLKYAEVISDLVGQGYSVYALDHRGQGASGRMTDDPQAGYVEYFQDYVDDLSAFIDQVVRAQPHPDVFILAHSMGGAVAVLYLDQHPQGIAAALLSSPMLEINTGAFPPSIATSIAGSDCGLSDGKSYAIGMGDYQEETSVADSTVTHSQARWQMQIDMYRAHPELRLGGATYRWVCESLAASSRAQGLGAYSNIPTLLLQAGADKVVKLGGEDRYCSDAPRCQKSTFASSFHEVLQEQDPIRNEALSETVRFFNHFAGSN